MAAPALSLGSTQALSLYAGALGAQWAELPSIVRRMHEEGWASGRLTIRRSRGPLSALVGWLCHFPPAGEDVPTRLCVQRQGEGQLWERSFNGHRLATLQRAWEQGQVGELLGPVECVFRLRPIPGGIAYEQVGAWLRLGSWRLPLPRLFSPRIEAITTVAPHGMHVQVKIGSALLGWMLTYEGLMSPEEAAS